MVQVPLFGGVGGAGAPQQGWTLRDTASVVPTRSDTSDDSPVTLLAILIAAGLAFGGPLFVRTIRHKDGDTQRHWVLAGPWEIAGLAIIFVVVAMAMGQG
jgi:hypothetical protein